MSMPERIILKMDKCSNGKETVRRFSLSSGNAEPLEARVACATNEGREIFITLGTGDHTCQRWKLSESLARKLRRELNERLD